jgi:hypothetical protein
MVARAALEDEALVAIGALDEILVAHFQEDPGVAQAPPPPSQATRLVVTSTVSGTSTGISGLRNGIGGRDHTS